MVIDEKESENTNEMDEEVTPTSDTNDMPVEEAKTEVPSTTMVKYSLNIQSFSSFL